MASRSRPSNLGAAAGRIVAAAGLATASDRHISESEVGAAAITAKDVVVIGIVSHSASNVGKSHPANLDPVGRVAGRSSILVILLDINSVVGDARKSNVLVDNVADTTAGAGIRLDATTILAVHDLGVFEGHSIDGVIALASNRTDAQPVATRAVQIIHSDLASTRNSDTVILIVDLDALESDVVTRLDVETIGIVSSGIITTGIVGLVTGGVVKREARDGEMLRIFNFKAVNGPILDIEIGNLGIVDFFDNNEVIGSKGLC